MDDTTRYRIVVYDEPDRQTPNVNLPFSDVGLAKARYREECDRQPTPDRVYFAKETITILSKFGPGAVE